MEETPFYKKPWFYIAFWLAILLIAYGWQISRMGGFRANLFEVFFDLACIFPILLILWMAFFAQFVLPVRTFRDRQKIFSRLFANFFGIHGPAIFIRNGELVKREGEERKQGAGVLWLDSASAAVTRTPVMIKQTIGPGVHFIENGEYVDKASILDLHIQSQMLGPDGEEDPFEKKKESQTDEEFTQIQKRREKVRALTRDGIEVIPNISLTFRVDTGFPKEGEPGSRFGYRTGIRKQDRENERKDKEVINKAILAEGVDPNAPPERHRVAWNRLPALLAVDLWREYVSKFTLDELFKPTQPVPPPLQPLPQPTEQEIEPLSRPMHVSGIRETMLDSYTKMLHEVNRLMNNTIQWLEGKRGDQIRKPPPLPAASTTTSPPKTEPEKKTALQVINEMVKARLTQEEVDLLDDTGQRRHGTMKSNEYKLLRDRGLKVLSVTIFNLRLNPQIEETIIRNWTASWLLNAKAESDQIERRRNLIESAGQEKAIRQYADLLSRDLIQRKPTGIKEALKMLLMRTRMIIFSNEQLRRRMTAEQEELEDIIKWVEGDAA